MNNTVMRSELLEECRGDVNWNVRQDGEILQSHGISIRLEVIDEIDELGVDVRACARVCRLGVHDIYSDRSAWATTTLCRPRRGEKTCLTLVVSSSWRSLRRKWKWKERKPAVEAAVVGAESAMMCSPACKGLI